MPERYALRRAPIRTLAELTRRLNGIYAEVFHTGAAMGTRTGTGYGCAPSG